MEIDFSSEEDEEELGGITIKNMGKLFNEQHKPRKEGTFLPYVDRTHYYNRVQMLGQPDSPTYKALHGEQQRKKKIREKEREENDNRFPDF